MVSLFLDDFAYLSIRQIFKFFVYITIFSIHLMNLGYYRFHLLFDSFFSDILKGCQLEEIQYYYTDGELMNTNYNDLLYLKDIY